MHTDVSEDSTASIVEVKELAASIVEVKEPAASINTDYANNIL
jgi:hypothetical protein